MAFLRLDWNNHDDQEKVHHMPFNLVQLQEKLDTGAVFTNSLLREIRDQKFAIQSELQRDLRHRTFFNVNHKTRFGEYKVWDDSENEDHDTEAKYNCVSIRLLSRIELHPDFQCYFWKFSRTNRILRVNNGLQGKNNWVPVPYALVVDALVYNEDHKSMEIMQGYWRALQKTKRLWLQSSSRRKILQMSEKIALRFKPITKIVCFGLGALNHDKALYESSLQHMTAFTIAKHLEQAYQKKFARKYPVKIILQDPCYTQKD
ncbi:hypothetical protein SVAN01_03632 [Stagonosporopsis vannaccii]|nr:hypothetical protein SVAN01_03632 [Stagonosporopsis vannaccii]